MRQSQKYSTTLQSYNTSLQNDINTEKVAREELARARDVLQGQVAELGGMARSLEQLLKQEQVRARVCLRVGVGVYSWFCYAGALRPLVAASACHLQFRFNICRQELCCGW